MVDYHVQGNNHMVVYHGRGDNLVIPINRAIIFAFL